MTAAPQTLRPAADTVDYTQLAAYFDEFAADEPRWRRRNRTYHRLLEQIYQFQIPEDVRNLLELSGFDVVTSANRILLPKRIPFLTTFLNGVVANVWPFVHFTLTYWIVARPEPVVEPEETVSVICPCRNEAGHVPDI